ncbi:hypothetical protein D3C86_1522420 [compost metagenome]
MIDKALGDEMGELAVNRAARLTAGFDHIGKAHRLVGKGDQLQQRDGLAERARVTPGFPLHHRNRVRLLPIGLFIIGHGNIHRHLS